MANSQLPVTMTVFWPSPTSVHLVYTYPYQIDGGGHVPQDPATHTTCLFGTFGPSPRNNIYLCFPNEGAADLEPQVIQEAIYKAVRKAHEEVCPDNSHEYSATFDAEIARSGNSSSIVILPMHGVEDFMRGFQQELKNAGQWVTTHYFIAQIRGVKDAYRHSDGCNTLLEDLDATLDTQRDRTVIFVDGPVVFHGFLQRYNTRNRTNSPTGRMRANTWKDIPKHGYDWSRRSLEKLVSTTTLESVIATIEDVTWILTAWMEMSHGAPAETFTSLFQ
ncbi:hypothetical protein B0H13DRAFT_1852483 [Mycena leptocephala]|nr:hypothetical protein B0H13DRAFT_1852483 [Mycena leptocephala]